MKQPPYLRWNSTGLNFSELILPNANSSTSLGEVVKAVGWKQSKYELGFLNILLKKTSYDEHFY